MPIGDGDMNPDLLEALRKQMTGMAQKPDATRQLPQTWLSKLHSGQNADDLTGSSQGDGDNGTMTIRATPLGARPTPPTLLPRALQDLITGEHLSAVPRFLNATLNPARMGYGFSKELQEMVRAAKIGQTGNAIGAAAKAAGWGLTATGLADLASLAPAAYSVARTGFREVAPEVSHAAMADFMAERPSEAGFLTPRTADEMRKEGMRTFLSRDGKSGYAIEPTSGDIRNVFNRPGGTEGAGAVAVSRALARGGDGKILDAFDTNLGNFYRDMGFKETERLPWNAEYAPAGWDAAKYGTPDVMMMRHPSPGTTSASRILRGYDAARAARKGGG